MGCLDWVAVCGDVMGCSPHPHPPPSTPIPPHMCCMACSHMHVHTPAHPCCRQVEQELRAHTQLLEHSLAAAEARVGQAVAEGRKQSLQMMAQNTQLLAELGEARHSEKWVAGACAGEGVGGGRGCVRGGLAGWGCCFKRGWARWHDTNAHGPAGTSNSRSRQQQRSSGGRRPLGWQQRRHHQPWPSWGAMGSVTSVPAVGGRCQPHPCQAADNNNSSSSQQGPQRSAPAAAGVAAPAQLPCSCRPAQGRPSRGR